MGKLDKFAGGDQAYLRDEQYRDPSRLADRARLHVKYRTAEQRWFPWLASQLDWPAEAVVLEVGCGPGWLWAEAADELPRGLRLILTDLSPGMVETAIDRVSALESFHRVEAVVADAQRLPFPDASFDVALANHMLYHAPEPGEAVAELARVLRPGGTLLAAANGPENMKELWEIRAEIFDLPTVSGLTLRFGSVSGLPLLQELFATVEWRTYPDQLRCTDPDDAIAFVTSYPPGEDADAGQLAALDRSVRARFRDGEGVFTITKQTGAFVARRPRH